MSPPPRARLAATALAVFALGNAPAKPPAGSMKDDLKKDDLKKDDPKKDDAKKDGAKKPPAAPPLDAKTNAETSAGAVALKPAPEGMVILAGGAFSVGTGMQEVDWAIELCEKEPLGELCTNFPYQYSLWAHTAHLDTYFLDRTEVTVAAYRRCVAASECLLPTFTSGDPKFDRDELPVTHVSWDDARKFCTWRGARLPTEAEWERAARGAQPRRYPWGMLPNPKLANHGIFDVGSTFVVVPTSAGTSSELLHGVPDPSDGFAGLAPVGSFPSGATPEGIVDLAGNVSEWVSDFWATEFGLATVGNPQGPPSGTMRVVRGGSYRHPMAMVRGSSRDRRPASVREPYIGFRCARSA